MALTRILVLKCFRMKLRHKLIDILIGLLSKDLSDMPKEPLTKDEYDGLMSQLWQTPAFRKYVADRDAKLIFTMAGSEGMAPEPRDAYVMHTGQRVEILILAREAKAAFNRMELQRQQKSALETAKE